MNFFISGLDLLLLTVSIIVYAAGATAWTYFAMPPAELQHPSPKPPAGAFLPEDPDSHREG